MDEKERFVSEFYNAVELVKEKYGKNETDALEIVGKIVNDNLTMLHHEIQSKRFVEFYKKHLTGTLHCDYNDFTKDEIEDIISQSLLSQLDKDIAKLLYIDRLTEDKIADKIQMDRKTIRRHIPIVSLELKKTCIKMFK